MTDDEVLALLDAGVRAYATRYARSLESGHPGEIYTVLAAMRDHQARQMVRKIRSLEDLRRLGGDL